MKCLKISALLLLLLLSTQAQTIKKNRMPSTKRSQQTLVELVQKVKPFVVSITIYDINNKVEGTGSGFFISPAVIVTNKHVIENAYSAVAKTPDGNMYTVQSILGVSANDDLVLLKLSMADSLKSPLVLANKLPLEGEDVFVLGNPRGLEWSISTGIVSAIRLEDNGAKMIQITAPISPGSSGSPVLNMQGEIIGVATASVIGGQNLNLAIPSAKILEISRSNEIKLADFSKSNEVQQHKQSEEIRIAGRETGLKRGLSTLERCELQIPYYKKAIQTYAKNAKAWNDIGFCFKVQGKTSEALNAYRESLKLAEDKNVIILEDSVYTPRYREEILFYSHLGLGNLFITNRNPINAEKELEILRQLLPYEKQGSTWEYWVKDLERQIMDYEPR